MPAHVNEQLIIDALHDVPPERWADVLLFIESLKEAEAEPRPIATGADLAGSDLFGIWADRDDIGDSQAFARRLREQASQRDHRGRSDAP
jgi:hypothetical protein